MTVDDATTAVDAATAALAKLDAEIARAESDAAEVLQTFAALTRARDAGDFDDAIKLATDLEAARANHDAAIKVRTDLEKMRKPLEKRVERAREELDAARREAAGPEAKRLEADTRKVFDKAFAALAKSRQYRDAHGLPCTGAYLTYDEHGSGGLHDLAASRGFFLDLRNRSM